MIQDMQLYTISEANVAREKWQTQDQYRPRQAGCNWKLRNLLRLKLNISEVKFWRHTVYGKLDLDNILTGSLPR